MPGAEQVDILLVNSPIHDYLRYPHFESVHSPPLGLLSLATTAARDGFRPSVYDAELHQATADQVVSEVRRVRPRWVGLNAFSVNIEVVKGIVRRLTAEPVRIMVGGPHVSNVSDTLLVEDFGESVVFVRGDAETAVVQLLGDADPGAVRGAFQGRTPPSRDYREPPAVVDLSTLPMIDRRFSEGEPFRKAHKSWYGLTLSRGCMFRCAFCAGSSHSNGMPYRAAPRDRALDEIAYLMRLGAEGIRIFDDLPFKGRHALLAFLAEAGDRFGDGAVKWALSFPLQYCSSLSEADWERLRRHGLVNLTIGLEAADFELRAALGKRITDTALWRTVHLAVAAGIGLKFYFIIGLPGESAASTDRTIALATRLVNIPAPPGSASVRCSIFVYKPMPGSKLWSELLRRGHSESQLLRYTDFVLSVEEFQKHAWQSALQLSELTPGQLARRINEFYSTTRDVNSEAYASTVIHS